MVDPNLPWGMQSHVIRFRTEGGQLTTNEGKPERGSGGEWNDYTLISKELLQHQPAFLQQAHVYTLSNLSRISPASPKIFSPYPLGVISFIS